MNDIIIAAGNPLDWEERKLNSFMKRIQECKEFVRGAETNFDHHITIDFIELHKKIKEKHSDNESIPDVLTIEEIQKKYQYARLYYVYSTIQDIADALGITLKNNKQQETTPTIAQYQTNVMTQTNVQTLSNLIENVNNLQIEQNQKDEIVKLVNEFEEEAQTSKNPDKLKNILKKVANISAKAGAFLFEHAKELGLLSLLLGV
ncbi:MAG: hypothetical protein OER78_04065 [Nitrosopumilus sp.]|nr:hypothetical protein [Nitrosopumilus sp.]MDH3854957.1 hypothetical protein [Nitrosopumilus sp.]